MSALNFVINPIWLIFLIASVGQVLARYVFNVPMMWAEEVARFALIWFCFLGAVQLVILDDHIEIDFLIRRVGKIGQQSIWLLRQLVILGTGLMLLRGTYDLIVLSRAVSPATGLPIAWWYAAGAAAGAGFVAVPALRIVGWATSIFKTHRTG